ncbi:hypothetical protein WR164_08020 [Philodulcilactobacillus myokoensis]|uniref:Signal recognition particle receptor FtsY n=1 Tax=Philodulcilactobacillus myokoensis TaxID=2929573 RepID=A0A9W6ESY2_9LACO|nr:signal recognition particle-docking protein FtsY [Philodulcilactobacillus myokoensis]GLB46823.1 hypothetical protein WR164_08020 [Philodulcilactobacillus myokoensis]
MGLFDIFKRKNKKNSKKNHFEQDHDDKNQKNVKKQVTKPDEHQTASETPQSNESSNSNESEVPKKSKVSGETIQSSEFAQLNEESSQNSSTTISSNNLSEEKSSEFNSRVSASSNASDSSSNSENTDHHNNEKSDDESLYEHGLAKSRSSFGQKLNALFAHFRSVNDEFFDDLEDTLIESDVGVNMAVKLTDQLRDEVKLRNAKTKSDVQNVIIKKLIDLYDQNGDQNNQINFSKKGPTVILFVGVNGAGKTTTIGKMANMYKQQGKKVLLAAADTFRAGAIEQLDVWAQRDKVDIVKKEEGSDPSSVVYDAIDKAKRENYDILFVDTAGRLQNKVNLMNELMKMKKVLTRSIPDAPHEVLLVLDATTGQNALNQAKLFTKDTNVSGIVLTKLDGTAKGGIVLAIRNEMHLPVKYVGLGEGVNDLRPFDANDFIYGLFKGLFKQN